MRITKVQVFPLDRVPIEQHVQEHGLVRIDTDEGISGWGSCFMPPYLVEASLKYLEERLIGQDPTQVEKVSEELHQWSYWFGRGGAITVFISGVDIALWDIMGKAAGKSVGRLLGGRYREKMKPYASLLFSLPVDRMMKDLEAAKARGFRAFKLGWAPFGRIDARTDEMLIKTARQTIGDDCDLMVDAGGSDAYWHNDLKWAINTANMLKDYNVTWFEEALCDRDLEGYKKLRQASPVWIATGECLRKRQDFYPWIFERAVDVLQPDLTAMGGISDARRLAWMANDYGILVVCHGWNTALGLAADLQLSAALSQARWVEYMTPTPYIDQILAKPFELDAEGYLQIPDSPGLGVEVDIAAVKKLAAAR